MDIFDQSAPQYFSPQVTEARRFYFPQRGRALSVVLSGGSERVDPHYDVNRQDVPFFAFEYVVAGSGTVKLGNQESPLRPGTFFTYGPRMPHRIRTNPDRPLVKFFIDCRPAPARRLMRQADLPEGSVWETSRPADLLRIATEIVQTGQRQAMFAAEICQRLIEVMLLTAAATRMPPGSSNSASFARYREACRVIEEHVGPLRSLRQVAQLSGVCEAYLCRVFRRYDQRTPYQYLRQVQMNRAAALLRKPGTLVAEAARHVGFDDPFHFSRVFRKHFGVSPKAYQQT